jgi:hypothetical protein
VTLSFEASTRFLFVSAVTWPAEALHEVVAEAVKDALNAAGGQHVNMLVTLKAIEWDEVNSSASGFKRAARAATLAALQL